MEPFRRLEAVALPLARANVDTDQIVPARFLKKPRAVGFGQFLFHDLRADAAFALDQAAYRGARIVVAGRNFACGSSREHAVWALQDYGFRAAIAPSFGDIFHSNALKNGFLPVVLPEAAVAAMQEALLAAPGMTIAIDLEQQCVVAAGKSCRFEIAPFPRHCLLEGLDELGYTLSQTAHIEAFEERFG
ncbi:MAG: 3-isopropylmalate dehydratase small subunit [Betaproteobacteria bacterium]|nr:MAG: 3-isopropylmalate dehydratase small subunit [Betaproteobacteria bacterium]